MTALIAEPTTEVRTHDDGSQLLITTYPDGRKTYADRAWSGATWGRPVEAVAR